MNCEAAYKGSSLAALVELLEPLTPNWGHNVGFGESYRMGRKPREYTWYFEPGESRFAFEPSAERIDLTANTVTRAVTAYVEIQGELVTDIEYGFDRLAYAIKSAPVRGGYVDARLGEAVMGAQDSAARAIFWRAPVTYRVLVRAQDPNPGQAETVGVAGQMTDPNGDLVGEVEAG